VRRVKRAPLKELLSGEEREEEGQLDALGALWKLRAYLNCHVLLMREEKWSVEFSGSRVSRVLCRSAWRLEVRKNGNKTH